MTTASPRAGWWVSTAILLAPLAAMAQAEPAGDATPAPPPDAPDTTKNDTPAPGPAAARPQDAPDVPDAAEDPAPDPAPATAQPPPGPSPPPVGSDAARQDPPAPPPRLTKRPKLIEDAQPTYPPQAWDDDVEGDVVVLITVDETGGVEECELVSSPGHGLGPAAVTAARRLRFSPAEVEGKPVAVRVRYTFRFRKPEKATLALPPRCPECGPGVGTASDPRLPGKLRGVVLERGTGARMAGVEVYILDLDEAVVTDERGRFERAVPPGGYALTLVTPGHYPHEVLERVEP